MSRSSATHATELCTQWCLSCSRFPGQPGPRDIPMNLREWSESEVEYGRKVLTSGLAGARSGRKAFLNGKPLTPFLERIVRDASAPAAVGAFVGLLGSLPGGDHKFAKR